MLRNSFNYLLFLLLIGSLESCQQKKSNDLKTVYLLDQNYSFPYTINEPDKKYELKEKLREISGLAYFSTHSLFCINDEEGIIYKYNLEKEEISKQYKFDKSGDYEAIEMVDSLVYILRSDGHIFKVSKYKEKDHSSQKIGTFLNAGNDAEGLGYEKESNSLLVACKGNPGGRKAYYGKKAIYRYSLDKDKLEPVPAFLIDLEKIRNVLGVKGYGRMSVKLMEYINPSEGDVTFQPSAVAVHPFSKNIYVLGSVGKLLIVLNPKGEMLAILKLSRKNFRQPEGLCFAPDGTMFISNEGKGCKANILKFNYKN